MRGHRVITLGTALATVAAAGVAGAEPHAAPLAIDCPVLGDDGRALLEARARAELAFESPGDGVIGIACLPSSATITWRPADGAPRERTVALDADRAATIDGLLDAIHAVLAAARSPAPSDPPPPSSAAAGVPPDVAVGAAPATPTAPVRISALAGGDAELWRGEIPAAVGLQAGLRITLPRGWSASLLAAPDWGVGSANGISAWSLQAIARVEHSIVGPLDIGIGATARMLWATGTSALTPPAQNATTGGGLLVLACEVPIGPVHLEAGPELEALVRPIIVQVGGAEVFRVPAFVAALTVEARAP